MEGNTIGMQEDILTIEIEAGRMDVGRFLAANLPYTRYLVISGESGQVVIPTKTNYFSTSPHHSLINNSTVWVDSTASNLAVDAVSDSDVAEACASIEAIMLENEMVDFEFDSIALSPFEDGSDFVSLASFSPIRKQLGKSLSFRLTLYLTINLTDTLFCLNNNPLAKFFLGISPLPSSFLASPYTIGEFYLQAFGENNAGGSAGDGGSTGDGGSAGDDEGEGKQAVELRVEISDDEHGGISITGDNIEAGEDGVIIHADGIPVAILERRVESASFVIPLTTKFSGSVRVGNRNLELYSLSMVDGSTLQNYEEFYSYRASTELKELPMRVGKDTRLVADSAGKYIALVTDTDLMLMEAKSLKMLQFYQNYAFSAGMLSADMQSAKKRVAVCEDGSVAFFGERLVLASKGGKIRSFDISLEDVSAVGISLIENYEGYFIAFIQNDYLYKYRVVGNYESIFKSATSKLELVGMKRVGNAAHLSKVGKSFAVVSAVGEESISGGNAEIEVFNENAVDYSLQKTLAAFLLPFDSSDKISLKAGIVSVSTIDAGESIICDIRTGCQFSSTSEVRLGGECIIMAGDNGQKICHFRGEDGISTLLPFEEFLSCSGSGKNADTTEEILDAAIAGERLFVTTNAGRIYQKQLVRNGIYIHHRELKEGDEINARAREITRNGGSISLRIYNN